MVLLVLLVAVPIHIIVIANGENMLGLKEIKRHMSFIWRAVIARSQIMHMIQIAMYLSII